MTRLLMALIAALLPVALRAAEPPQTLAWVEESRHLVAQFGAELKAELMKAMADGGPAAAIEVCHTRAPAIAARLSESSGARVRRTALRVRNPANAPDALERSVLEQFSTEFAAGTVDGPLEAVFETRRGETLERRYMRAIPTDALCLTCHGGVLAAELAAAIARDYPDDQATGFEQGDLRGAFSVTWSAASAAPDP